MTGACVHEASDFNKAIVIVANGGINLGPFMASVNTLPETGKAFADLNGNKEQLIH